MDLGLGADVNAARGLVQDEDTRLRGEPLGQHHLLLISTRQAGDHRVETRGPYAKLVEQRGRLVPFARPIDPAEPRQQPQRRQRRIAQGAFRKHQTLPLAVFRNEADAVVDGLSRTVDAHARSVHVDLARGDRIESKQCAGKLRPAGSHQPREADYLAGVQRERHVLEMSGHGEVLRTQHFRALHGIARHGNVLCQRPPDHHLDQVGLAEIGCRSRGDMRAVAQHTYGITEREDLGHAVRDENARDAAPLEPRKQRVQPIGFGLTEAAGGLVEHDDACAATDGRRDLHHLSIADGELTQPAAHVEHRARFGEQRRRTSFHRPKVHEPAPARNVGQAEVLGDGHVLAERQLLMHHGDARRDRVVRAGQVHLLSEHEQSSLVGRLEPRENPAEGALPRPIFATQGVARSLGNVERHVGERLHAGKALADVVEAYGGPGHDRRTEKVELLGGTCGATTWAARCTPDSRWESPNREAVVPRCPGCPC